MIIGKNSLVNSPATEHLTKTALEQISAHCKLCGTRQVIYVLKVSVLLTEILGLDTVWWISMHELYEKWRLSVTLSKYDIM